MGVQPGDAAASPFAVDLDALDLAVGRMTRCGTELGALIDDLTQRIASLRTTWEGQAATAHAAAHAEWEGGYRAMQEALGGMRAAASVAHGNYSSAVEANVAMWEQVS